MGSNDSNSTFTNAISVLWDPTVQATFGVKGALLMSVPPGVDAALYLKQDNGLTTNWVKVGGNPSPIVNPHLAIYISPDGSDTTGNGGVETPFKTLTKALSVIPISDVTHTIFAYPGDYPVETTNPIVWRRNLNLVGLVANNTVFDSDFTLTAASGDSVVFQWYNVAMGNGLFTVDLALAGFFSMSFVNGKFQFDRVDTNPSGIFNIQGALFASTLGGSVLMSEAVLFEDITVVPGSEIVVQGGINVGGRFVLQGNSILRTTNFYNQTGGSYVNGTVVGGNTPTWQTDVASNGVFTGAVNKIILNSGPSVLLARYISPQGSNTQGDGTATNPFLSITHALSTCPADANVYTIFAYPGNYPIANETSNPIVWPNNVYFTGLSAQGVITLPSDFTFTGAAGSFNFWIFSNAAIQGLFTMNFAASTFGAVKFIEMSSMRFNRTDSNAQVSLTIQGIIAGNGMQTAGPTFISGGPMFNPVIVLPGGNLTMRDMVISGTHVEVQGTGVLQTNQVSSPANYVTGTVSGGNTPTWKTDPQSNQPYSGTLNKLVVGDPAPVTTQIIYVGKNGVNQPGNGNYGNPYADPQYAETQITDASPTKIYILKLSPGHYTTANWAKKANIFVDGGSSDIVTITDGNGSIDLDNDWTSANPTGGFSNVTLATIFNYDLFDTGGSVGSVLSLQSAVFAGGIFISGRGAADHVFATNCILGTLGGSETNTIQGALVFFGYGQVFSPLNILCDFVDGDVSIENSQVFNSLIVNQINGHEIDLTTTASILAAGLSLTQTDGMVHWTSDSTSYPNPTGIIKSGTIGQSFLSFAPGLRYDPSTPSNWPTIPTSVQEALDDLSAGGLPFTASQIVYVSAGGSNVTGNGSFINPYADPQFAESQITDASQALQYVIYMMPGTYTTAGWLVKPNINLYCDVVSSARVVDTSGTIGLDPSWNTASNSFATFNVHFQATGLNFDFAAIGATSNTTLNFTESFIEGPTTIRGNAAAFLDINWVGGGCASAITFASTTGSITHGIFFSTIEVNTTGGVGITEFGVLGCVFLNNLIITQDSGFTIGVALAGNAFFGGQLIGTQVDAAVIINSDASSLPLHASVVLTGGAVIVNTNDSYALAFTPTTAADWQVTTPTILQSALDQIGAGNINSPFYARLRQDAGAVVNFVANVDYAIVVTAVLSNVVLPAGQEGLIAKIKSVNGATISTTGGETIDGLPTLTLTPGQAADLIWHGANWFNFDN